MVTSCISFVLISVETSFTSVLPRLSFIGSPFSSKIFTSTSSISGCEDDVEEDDCDSCESEADVLPVEAEPLDGCDADADALPDEGC